MSGYGTKKRAASLRGHASLYLFLGYSAIGASTAEVGAMPRLSMPASSLALPKYTPAAMHKTNSAPVRYQVAFTKVSGLLHSAHLACTLEACCQAATFRILNQNHRAEQDADYQNHDHQKVSHGFLLFIQTAASLALVEFFNWAAK